MAEQSTYYLYQPARIAEGWEIFESEWGMEIERLDDPIDAEGREVELLPGDLHAVRVMLVGALEGKAHALDALHWIDYDATVFGTLEAALEAVERGLADTCIGMCIHPNMVLTWDMLHTSHLYLSHLSEETPPQDTDYHFRPTEADLLQ